MRKWNWAPKQKHILFDEIDSRLRLIRKKCEPIQSYCRSYCRSEKTALIIWDIRCFVTLYLCFGFYISILPFSVSLNLIFLRYQTLSLLFFVKLSSVLHNIPFWLIINLLLVILLCFQPPSVSLFGTHGRYLLFLSHV